MLSKLSLRAGALGPLLKCLRQGQVLSAAAVRFSSTDFTPTTRPPKPTDTERVKAWDEANKVFYGPDRDHKNHPHPVIPETSPPTRMGFIPESWFQMLYNKTGVTGPYMLGTGVALTLISKEFYVLEHTFIEVLGFVGICICLMRAQFVAKFTENLDKYGETLLNKRWHEPLALTKKVAQEEIDANKNAIWQMEGESMVFQAKRENVDLQLESIYRARVQEVHQAVKKRLDYQLENENAKKSYEQVHMTNWVVDNVRKGITPQQEKDSLVKCIADLKLLAANYKP